MSTTKRSFDKALEAFVNSNKEAMKCARECAELAIDHLYEHGDTAYLQRFLGALEANWNRVVAYKQWLLDFTPVTLHKDNMSIDQEKKAKLWPDDETKAALLKAAKVDPFWTYSPDHQLLVFDFNKNVIERIENVLKQAHNTNKYTPESVQAHVEQIAQMERLVSAVKAGTIASLLPTATPPSDAPKKDQSKLTRNGQFVPQPETVVAAA